MNSQLVLANILRWIARIVTIPLILGIILYLLFVGLQLLSGESGHPVVTSYMLLLALMLAGLVIGWWKESLGAAIGVAAILGFFVLSQLLPGSRSIVGSSLFTGPLDLLAALNNTYPFPRSLSWVAWALTAPVWLFLASYLLRRNQHIKDS